MTQSDAKSLLVISTNENDMMEQNQTYHESHLINQRHLTLSAELHSLHQVTRMEPCCTSCGKEMKFEEGDIIYGENWYHVTCWRAKNANLSDDKV